MRCGRRPGGCCGTATPREPRTWRPRCADSSPTACSPRRPCSWSPACTVSPARTCCAVNWTCCSRPRLAVGARRPRLRKLLERKTPYHNEPDLVERIGYRELNYGAVPDGGRWTRPCPFREIASGHSRLRRRALRPRHRACLVHLADCRDLRRARSDTPPAVARRIADVDPRLCARRTADCRPQHPRHPGARRAARSCKAVYAGAIDELPARQPNSDAPRRALAVRLMVRAIGRGAMAESAVPAVGAARRASRSLLHEADRGVVQVADACGAEVGEVAAHRDVARPLDQRQAVDLPPRSSCPTRWRGRGLWRGPVRTGFPRSWRRSPGCRSCHSCSRPSRRRSG